MRAAEIRVVDDIDVARLRRGGAALADQPDQFGGRILHRPDKDGQAARPLRDQGAVIGGVDAVGPVIRLGDDRREGSPRKAEVHFITDLLQAGLNDTEGNGIEAHQVLPTVTRMLPSLSETALSCGSMRIVVSICSRIAGPEIRASSGSFSRA